MWGSGIETRSALIAAVGIAMGAAGCATAGRASGTLPSGEPVPIGYAAALAETPTGAVMSLSGERLESVRATRIEDLLAGRPGLSVTRRADGRVSVRIRGPQTLMGNTEPLVVIDGIPVEYDSGGLLRDLHPRDIARIDVLKDAASTAIFGVRGGAGVIMITTKRAR